MRRSTGLRDIITNEQLRLVRNDYLEPDFATGNIDRGVQKSATKLTSIIERGLQKKAEDKKANDDQNEGGTTAGKIAVLALQIFLYISLGAIALFAILFVVAIFNDSVAEFMRKYIFNRKKKQRYVPEDYYDERLYGNRQPERARRPESARQPQRRAPERYPAEYRERPRQNPAPRPRPNPQNRMRDEYSNQRQNHADVYYNADGSVRRPRNPENTPARYTEDDATRTFSVPEQYNRRR